MTNTTDCGIIHFVTQNVGEIALISSSILQHLHNSLDSLEVLIYAF